MKKKLALLAAVMLLAGTVFAYDVPKNEEYYKSQIQNQRFLYNTSGIVNAINKGNTEVVDYFMKAGFNPNSTFTGQPLLMYAVNYNKTECVDVLLEAGAEATSKALFQAIFKKSSVMVNSLIKHNVDVNAKQYGMTPLNYAIRSKQPLIVEALLKAGATADDETNKLIKKSKDEYIKDLFNTESK